MADSTDDYSFTEDYSLAPLQDDCALLGALLDDCLRSEVGAELFNKVERIRSLAQCAAQLANKHDAVRLGCDGEMGLGLATSRAAGDACSRSRPVVRNASPAMRAGVGRHARPAPGRPRVTLLLLLLVGTRANAAGRVAAAVAAHG